MWGSEGHAQGLTASREGKPERLEAKRGRAAFYFQRITQRRLSSTVGVAGVGAGRPVRRLLPQPRHMMRQLGWGGRRARTLVLPSLPW